MTRLTSSVGRYYPDLTMDLPDGSRNSSSSSLPHRPKQSSKNSSKHRRPQLKQSNQSAAERGLAMRARLDELLAGFPGPAPAYAHAYAHDDDDAGGWTLVARSESDSSAATGTSGSSSSSSTADPVRRLTRSNIQMLNTFNNSTSGVPERIWLREKEEAAAAAARRTSLKKHHAKRSATLVSDGTVDILEPWAPAGDADDGCCCPLDTFATGGWITDAERRASAAGLYVLSEE